MLRDFVSTGPGIHAEYRRRLAEQPEPLDQPRHGLRETIGHGLITLGKRLAGEDRPVDRAA